MATVAFQHCPRQADRHTDGRTDRQTDRQTDNEDGTAAFGTEKKKDLKYSREIAPGGHHSECIPLVFEHFGRWGWEAQKYFLQISKASVDNDGKNNSNFFKTFWRRRFTIPYNAAMLELSLESCQELAIQRTVVHTLIQLSLTLVEE